MVERLSLEDLRAFDVVAARHVEDGSIPGLVALVARGDDVHVRVEGKLSIDGQPAQRDSLFRIASTTKPITAALTLAAVREGLFTLDEPVDRLVPELADRKVLKRPDGPLDDTVPAERPITVRDLLTFTFGFGMSADMFMATEPWPVVARAEELNLATIGPPNPDVQPDPDTWIAALGSLPLLAQPGQRWLYNTGCHVLGVLLARAAGQPIAEVFKSRLFEPLGMRDTAFWTADTERLATGYAPIPTGGLRLSDSPHGQWSRPPAFGDAAAGLISTVDDLLAFARMLLRGGAPLLDANQVEQMTTDQLTPAQRIMGQGILSPDRSWGFGQSVIIDGPRTGAYGWDGGLGSSWLVDPKRELTVIVLTQRMFESPALPSTHRELQEAAYAAVDHEIGD